MDISAIEAENEEYDRNLSVDTDAESSKNSDSRCPVHSPSPLKAIYVKGNRCVGHKKYIFKYSYRIPGDDVMTMEHIHFLLECFVISAGPELLQLGRYHPQSNPEDFVEKDTAEDSWSQTETEDDEIWTKLKVPNININSVIKEGEASTAHDEINGNIAVSPRASSSQPKIEPRRAFSPSDFTSPDHVIVRELSEMRLVLERLLDTHDVVEWDHTNGLRDVLELLPGNIIPNEPSPHYPVGEWEYDECGICLEKEWLYRRACCDFPACANCLQNYFSTKVDDGQVQIECCNMVCKSFVHRDEISARLSLEYKEKFHKLLVLANQDANTKTCPYCSHVLKMSNKPKHNRENRFPNVTCPSCGLEWCFTCHAPWHGPLSCKQFRKGDRLLRSWARERKHGQLNAQKCPKCKIYIQRTTGCDHMHCTRCKTDFCYKCGERFRYLKFFGDHYSKLSVFGCKYRFKADQPMQRKLIRGAIFGGKVFAAPVLGALALCAGALAVSISLFALPVYGGVRLYRHCEGRQTSKGARRQAPTYHIHNATLQECLMLPET